MPIVTRVRGRAPARATAAESTRAGRAGRSATSRRGRVALLALGALLLLAFAAAAAPAGAAVYTGGAVSINSQGPASPYPSEIVVAGVDGTITKLTVTLTGLSHTFPADLEIFLVGPTGASVALLADWGAGTDVNADLTFDDSAPQVPNPIVSGTWHPTIGGGTIEATPPAPATWGVALSVYRDTSPNGTWGLYVYDDLAGDAGSIAGWSLDITLTSPSVGGFSPASGPVGGTVKVFGAALTGATAVAFNGTAATSFTIDSATQITATVPAGATTGPISVTTAAGTAASATDFTVIPAPTVGGFAPASGPAGTAVTVTGTSLTGATAVAFHGTPATSFTVDSDTQITATVPAGPTTGAISVTTAAGTAASATDFTVIPAPTVGGFAPASGPVGTVVTVTGAGFSGATAVAFDDTPATSFAVDSDTQITVTVPMGATTGRVSVATPNGSGSSATKFTVSGAYRFTLQLGGLTGGVLTFGESLAAKGTVRPAGSGGGSVRLTVQQKRGGRWVKAQAVARTVSASGAYSWRYRPATKGAYRIRGAIDPTNVNTLATTPWHRFSVK